MVKEHNTGVEYLRVSYDPSGRLRSPDEQHGDNETFTGPLGITLGEPYAEPKAVSASHYGRRSRGAFSRLMSDLRSGEFAGDVLVLWEPSRGSRQAAEWMALIDACRDAEVRIAVTTHGRIYDPGHGRDRRTLQEDAVDSEYDSWKTRERVVRAMVSNATAGRPHAHVPYGYARVYDERSGALVSQEAHEPEAMVVRELYERLAGGGVLSQIARDFEERGIRKRSGKPFSIIDLRELALRACYAGYRVHRQGTRSNRGHWHEGAIKSEWWPPLVDEEIFHAVRQTLTDPKRLKHRPAASRYVLSGIAVCDPHGCGIYPAKPKGLWRYRCYHVQVPLADLDEYVTGAMLDWLSRRDVVESWAARATGDDVTKLRAELARARAEYDAADPDRSAPADLEEARAVAALRRGLAERIVGLERRERELTVPPVLAGLAGPNAAARWAEAEPPVRREVARLLLTPEVLGQVRVLPWPKGRGVRTGIPIEDRVVWSSAEADVE